MDADHPLFLTSGGHIRRDSGCCVMEVKVQGDAGVSCGIQLLKKIFGRFGIGENRLRPEWVAVSESDRFISTVEEMTEQIRQLGPFNTNGGGRQDG
jgi:coenzyme F420-reducing hydrogenase delta subunit